MADEQYQDYPTGVDNVHASFSMENLFLEDYPALPELSWGEFLWWVLRRRSRHRISGRSMLPLLQPGDEVLYHPRAYEKASPQVGDVVIAQHPQRAGLAMIKRIGAIERDSVGGGGGGDRYFLLGDNRKESSDSRSFGWVTPNCIAGRVQCLFSSHSSSFADSPSRF